MKGLQLICLSASVLCNVQGFGVSVSSCKRLSCDGAKRFSATRQDRTEFLDDNDIDKEGDYYEPCTKSFQDFAEQMEALAFLSSVDRKAAQGAQDVFDEMYDAYIMDGNYSLWPNVTIYNLLIDAHAWSSSPKGGTDSEHILERMEDDTVEGIARPNVDTYIKVMEAWANRKQPQRAEQVFERLCLRYELTGDEAVRPNTGAYNKLIKAWMKTGNGEKAQALLTEMLQKYKNGDDVVKPNRKTWVQVMNAYGRNHEAVEDLLDEMEELYRETGDAAFQPNVQCYNALVKVQGQTLGPVQAEETLHEMVQAGNSAIRPNGATFVHVYNAYRCMFKDPDEASVKVEKLLELQESINDGTKDGILDVRSYNAVLAVLSRAIDADKSQRAKQILERMKQQSTKQKEMTPNLRTYNNVLNACAYTKDCSPQESQRAFLIAVEILNELRNSPKVKPNTISYGLFLKACAQLMPPTSKRDAVVENVFRKCCSEGQVGTFVLEELSRAASRDLCKHLLGGDMEDGVNLPVEWSRNIKDARQKLQ